MQRRPLDLSPEERKFVNRSQLAVFAVYATIALAGVVVLHFTPAGTSGTLRAQVKAANPTVPANVQ